MHKLAEAGAPGKAPGPAAGAGRLAALPNARTAAPRRATAVRSVVSAPVRAGAAAAVYRLVNSILRETQTWTGSSRLRAGSNCMRSARLK